MLGRLLSTWRLLDITDGKGSASVVANGVDAVKGTFSLQTGFLCTRYRFIL